jgi:hypothetical protein
MLKKSYEVLFCHILCEVNPNKKIKMEGYILLQQLSLLLFKLPPTFSAIFVSIQDFYICKTLDQYLLQLQRRS